MTESDFESPRDRNARDICDLFGVKPYLIGVEPVPRSVRAWWFIRKRLGITWLIRRRIARRDASN